MRRPVLFYLFVICAGACGRSGPAIPGTGESTGAGFPLPVPKASPTSPIDPPGGFGDGRDGSFAPTTDVQPTTCVALTLGSGMALTLGSALPLVAGDRLLLIQVQDDFAASGDPAPPTADAARCEVAEVSSAAGTAIDVVAPLANGNGYHSDATRRAQACKMPQYVDVVLDGVFLSAPPWDGTKGGVVAFFVNGTLTVSNSGGVNVDALGFAGGARSGSSASNSVTTLDPVGADGGGKGHGTDGKTAGTPFGRGNFASGGGGGNARSAGGGGGGNAGAGGAGGRQLETMGNVPLTAGLGGARVLIPDSPRLAFGGGGGSGHDGGDGGSGTSGSGGRGGGGILVIARSIDGDGSFSANGARGSDGPIGSAGDQGSGAGGGGAGGTIMVVSNSAGGFAGSLTALGGEGGTTLNESLKTGPGGGGGGGWILAAELDPALSACGGGPSGICLDDDVPFGAVAGEDCPPP